MMNWHIDGLDRLSVSYASLSRISDDDLWAIIEPAANTLKDKMQMSLSGLVRTITGSLLASIEVKRKRSGGVVYALVGPNDKKHPKSSTGRRKPRAQGGGGGSYAGTNAEVGWILEYGSSRIPGRHWMELAVTSTEEELHEMLEAGFNAYCDAVGL